MESINGHNVACCNVPPVVTEGRIELKGKYETIGDIKTYVTGPSASENAILIIYDIFGYFPQTLQGADILSLRDKDKDHSYQVFMPDFFEGEPCNIEWYPPVTDDQKKNLYGWFSTRGPNIAVDRLPRILTDIEAKYGKKTWAALGFCWGGKVVALTSGADTPFKVSAQCHPGMINPEDAAKVTIPMCILASKEEEPAEVEAFAKALKVENHLETFGTQIHGWMSARSNLADAEVKKEYERGYHAVSDFFRKHM